jgi:adenine phosphoribosyltransferase
MEVRLPAFASGTKVLLADQWVETGGTMDGAIRLVERQGGQVVALAAVAIEDNDVTRGYRSRFKCVAGVMAGSRWQMECNAQKLSSFATYKPEDVFPKIR